MKIKLILIIFSFYQILKADYMSEWSIFPIATHSPGDKGTYWKTDCSVINYNPEKIKIKFSFYPQNNYLDDISIIKEFNAYESAIVSDIVKEFFSYEGSGFLKMDASNYTIPSNPPDVSIGAQCRIYNTKEDGSTYGQSIHDQFFQALWSHTPEGIVIGVINNDRFRTNIGLACHFWGSNIKLTYYDISNNILGEETKFVDAYQVIQFRFPYTTNGGWIKVRMIDDDFCWVYISIIDNLSGDASFFPPFFELNIDFQEKEKKYNKMILGIKN